MLLIKPVTVGKDQEMRQLFSKLNVVVVVVVVALGSNGTNVEMVIFLALRKYLKGPSSNIVGCNF